MSVYSSFANAVSSGSINPADLAVSISKRLGHWINEEFNPLRVILEFLDEVEDLPDNIKFLWAERYFEW